MPLINSINFWHIAWQGFNCVINNKEKKENSLHKYIVWVYSWLCRFRHTDKVNHTVWWIKIDCLWPIKCQLQNSIDISSKFQLPKYSRYAVHNISLIADAKFGLWWNVGCTCENFLLLRINISVSDNRDLWKVLYNNMITDCCSYIAFNVIGLVM